MTDEEREDLNTFRHDLVKQARWWQWKAETLEKENEQLKAENAALRERLNITKMVDLNDEIDVVRRKYKVKPSEVDIPEGAIRIEKHEDKNASGRT